MLRRMRALVPLSFVAVLFTLASCSSDDSNGGGATGGTSGSGGSVTGGTGGSTGGTGGATGGTGGASGGSAGATGGSAGATGGSAGADAGSDAAADASSDGAADASSDAPADSAGDTAASCSVNQACCSGSTCTGGYNCLGTTCSCIKEIHGDSYLRTDGTVVYYGAPQTVIEEGTTGQPLGNVKQIYDGWRQGCALKNDNTVWCWPKSTLGNSAGQLGNGTKTAPTNAQLFKATQVLTAAATPLTGVKRISSGDARCYLATNTCAVKTDGTLWCWGSHDSSGGGGGSLFNTVYAAQPYATQIKASASTNLTGVEEVSQGTRHACVLKDGGQVWCWGSGIGGALGQGDEMKRDYPVKVTLPAAASVVGAGSDATCALVGTSVHCWGSNNGQIGIGDPETTSDKGCPNFCKKTPVQVIDGSSTPITGVKSLSMNYLSVCATMSDHSLHCWGSGAGNVAGPLMLAGNPVTNVAQHTSCTANPINQSVRTLSRDNVLKRATLTVTQLCQ